MEICLRCGRPRASCAGGHGPTGCGFSGPGAIPGTGGLPSAGWRGTQWLPHDRAKDMDMDWRWLGLPLRPSLDEMGRQERCGDRDAAAAHRGQ